MIVVLSCMVNNDIDANTCTKRNVIIVRFLSHMECNVVCSYQYMIVQ